MPDLYDAVEWRNLEGKPGAKVGYADGPVSAWPAEAWATLTEVVPWRITVTADPAHELFDSETGNAGTDAVAQAVDARREQGRWSVVYTNAANLAGLQSSLNAKSLRWAEAGAWPAPGVYLWAAAPGTPPGTIPSWCPVSPVAVQDRWEQTFDVSSCYGHFPVSPAPAPGPAPVVHPPPAPAPAPAPQECAVNLPVVQEGARGATVVAVQKLVGGIAVDGIFGPATHAAVIAHQQAARLAADGIVGTHTWGSLLGAPQ
jgi:peptidoglycan hydrolase-like protein with peptidoglycan-binding domain